MLIVTNEHNMMSVINDEGH